MAEENLNNSNREFKSLQKSFGNWDTGMPSSDVWENLEADLAVSAVWDRLDETLEANGSSADKVLTEAYENWSPNNSGDGWSKLEEQLSRERVWTRLNTTLSYPITTSIPWVKMAAASLIFTFLAFYTDRYRVADTKQESLFAFNTAENGTNSEASGNRQIAQGNTSSVDGTNPVPANEVVNGIAEQKTNAQKQLALTNPNNRQTNEKGIDNDAINANQNRTQNNTVQTNEPKDNVALTSKEETNTDLNDLATLDELGRKEISVQPGVIGDFEFLPYKSPFKPRFSALVGGQFAFINEKDRSAFSSSIPSMGIAADFQYHLYSRRFRFTQDLGFSQYAQSNGSYVNGRYTNSNQKLNTIYLMSAIGYTFKGVTFYGGISVNRLLNGYEENRTTITNVYNSKKLQVGATAGIDYHFTPFRNKTALGLGMQYQFVSRLKSENTVFNDIQGVKLQIKYSF
ncbi:hypothetical protein [Fluviicola taffensis]|uniref:hypothetical protein n=1 Tax=Fluviicola taffensis TaxID=191579 RepID=UPI00313785A9